MNTSVENEARPKNRAKTVCVLGAVTVVSVTAVVLAGQPKGVEKLKAYAGVIAATAGLVAS